MPADKRDVISGLKEKAIVKITFTPNGSFLPGHIGIMGDIETLKVLGYDDSDLLGKPMSGDVKPEETIKRVAWKGTKG